MQLLIHDKVLQRNQAAFGDLPNQLDLIVMGDDGLMRINGREPSNETALLQALDRGVPQHALLDVFATEPLPPDSRFWIHQRVTITAHRSGMSRGNPIRNEAFFLAALKRNLAGERLRNEVDSTEVLAGPVEAGVGDLECLQAT